MTSKTRLPAKPAWFADFRTISPSVVAGRERQRLTDIPSPSVGVIMLTQPPPPAVLRPASPRAKTSPNIAPEAPLPCQLLYRRE